MRKHFFRLAAIFSAVAVFSQGAVLTGNAAKQREVDTIVLETEAMGEEDVAVDLGWKTEQDKGKWIEDMGIAEDCDSLVLVINNESDGSEDLPDKDSQYEKKRTSRREVVGNSRLYYFNQSQNGHWNEVFSINCMISGGPEADEDIYGIYRPQSSFGSRENPGSLVPYKKIGTEDQLVLDPDSEDYGRIVDKKELEGRSDEGLAVCLEEMKAYSNYGMILFAEGDEYPALVLNCQQANTVDRTFGGIQLSEKYVRMLIQSIDENTRIMIASEVEELEGL